MYATPKSLVSLIKKLNAKKYRDELGIFLVEGEKSVLSILSSSGIICKMHSLLCTREFFFKYKDLLENSIDPQPHLVTPEQLTAMSSLESNNAAIAICHKLANATEILPNEPAIALCSIRDPGNFGTILRTAHWFGIKRIVCSPGCVDLYNPKVIQSSMGSFLHVQVVYKDLANFLSKTKKPVIGAYPTGGSLYDTSIPDEAVLLVGSESHGIDPSLEPYISDRISVPRVAENIDSLNAAVATAIICSWWRRLPHSADIS